MKIKFIKEYCACFRDENGSINTETFKRGDTVSTSMEADRYFTEELAQWLIDNGFAEEVKESGGWNPKLNEKYFYVASFGGVLRETWNDLMGDRNKFSIGNVFKTEGAAERYRDYLKAIATVRQDEGVLTPEQAAKNGYIYYICIHNEFGLVVHGFNADYVSVNTVLFDTREHAQASRDKHPDEWKTIANYDWSRE